MAYNMRLYSNGSSLENSSFERTSITQFIIRISRKKTTHFAPPLILFIYLFIVFTYRLVHKYSKPHE